MAVQAVVGIRTHQSYDRDAFSKGLRLTIRKDRGTTEDDLRWFFVKYVALNPGCTIHEIKDAFLSDLGEKVKPAIDALLREGYVVGCEAGYSSMRNLKNYYSVVYRLALYYLEANSRQCLNFSDILGFVDHSYPEFKLLRPVWKSRILSFALATLVDSDRVRERYDPQRGLHLYQAKSVDSPNFSLLFKLRSDRGNTDADVRVFILKLLVSCEKGLTAEEISRTVTYELEQSLDRIRSSLLRSGIIAESEERYSFSGPFSERYTFIKANLLIQLTGATHPIAVPFLEASVKANYRTRYDDPDDEYLHNLCLSALAEMDANGVVRLISRRIGNAYRLYATIPAEVSDGTFLSAD